MVLFKQLDRYSNMLHSHAATHPHEHSRQSSISLEGFNSIIISDMDQEKKA